MAPARASGDTIRALLQSWIPPEGPLRALLRSALLQCPNGITLDLDRNLYVANFDNGDVVGFMD
ncbi:MAG: hypothetical protein OEU54_14395 [Gemmatimonadota bacterium]|nr:hypothetical protein [Gemmatimonadota bacterium]